MANDYTLFNVTVSVLTPLHIGNGRELLQDYDYAVCNGKTWRINEDALLDAQDVDDPALADKLARTPPAQLLRPDDFKPGSPFFHYVLSGTPRSQQPGAQLREQLKDTFSRPYLPGSSLKGALRTALAWHGFQELRVKISKSSLDRNAKWAAQRIERGILGQDPNHDLLRALHVSDSAPLSADRLALINAQVVTQRGTGSPIEVEAIRRETVFQLTVKIDDALFSDWAKELGLGEKGKWLHSLAAIAQKHTAVRVKHELAWYTNRPGAKIAYDFYQLLAGLKLHPNACVLQIGWGGGWDSKTLGSHLRRDEQFLEGVISDYSLARGKRQTGDPFPKSRRAEMSLTRSKDGRTQEKIGLPLGWVLMQMEEAR